MIKSLLKRLLKAVGVLSIIQNYRAEKATRIVYNVNKKNEATKRCLLIYITKPFIEENYSAVHQNLWQATEIVRILGTQGFTVDVADFNYKKSPRYQYDLVLGLIPRGIDIYSSHLKDGAKKIAYLTSMNLRVTTENEQRRLDELKKRRGVELLPRRGSNIVIDESIEQFDACWHIGNSYNFKSYDCFKMPPVYYIKNSGYAFNWANDTNKRDPKSFVFFGSSGQVHKGLDLLLEIFSSLTTECKLYVCSCYESEQDFCQEYHKELYESPNIIPMGFVDIQGDKFKEMVQSCAFTILPSCAEGCAGSVLSVMSGGLIPIVSDVCGFDDDEAILLPDCSIETIASYIMRYSQMDDEWINENSRKAIETVKNHFSQRNFSESVEYALNTVLNKQTK